MWLMHVPSTATFNADSTIREISRNTMILGQIAWVDCAVFLLSLAPQLVFRIGLFATLGTAVKALPFLSMSSR